MLEIEEDMEFLQRSGRFGSDEEVLAEAFRALLRDRPELRVDLAVEKYKTGDVSLNRAAEIAGTSSEEFKEILSDRGINRDFGFLPDENRDEKLSEL